MADISWGCGCLRSVSHLFQPGVKNTFRRGLDSITDGTVDAFNIVRTRLPTFLSTKIPDATGTLPPRRSGFSQSIPDETHLHIKSIHDLLTGNCLDMYEVELRSERLQALIVKIVTGL
jgi:hypothetical protein